MSLDELTRPNFKAQEFIKSNTAEAHGLDNLPTEEQGEWGIWENANKLADKMQELRVKTGLPVTITSGFRNEEVNKLVGGSTTSWHMKFLACDFNLKGLLPNEGVLLIKRIGISLDKCFVERGCIHIQFNLDDSKNRNVFGTAFKEGGKWKVINDIKNI